jgi:hypothetical protein
MMVYLLNFRLMVTNLSTYYGGEEIDKIKL